MISHRFSKYLVVKICTIYVVVIIIQILTGGGEALLPFADDLIICLKKCFHLKSKSASLHTARVSSTESYVYLVLFCCGLSIGFS